MKMREMSLFNLERRVVNAFPHSRRHSRCSALDPWFACSLHASMSLCLSFISRHLTGLRLPSPSYLIPILPLTLFLSLKTFLLSLPFRLLIFSQTVHTGLGAGSREGVTYRSGSEQTFPWGRESMTDLWRME